MAGVVELLRAIRLQSEHPRRPTYVDFRPIRKVTPTAALVLVAELYRWNRILSAKRGRGRARLRTRDVSQWDIDVRELLDDMGFFDLLQVDGPVDDAEPEPSRQRTRFVKFRTNRKPEGSMIRELRKEDLEPVFGAIPSSARLYGALTEAMINVGQHAYAEGTFCPNWYLSAAHDVDGSVSVMIYDQGIGIPKSLPAKWREQIRGLIVSGAAEMIEAAHELSRTASGVAYRGQGLQRDVREYLEYMEGDGEYRVLSLEGEYIRRRENGNKHDILRNHDHALPGTLIIWRLERHGYN